MSNFPDLYIALTRGAQCHLASTAETVRCWPALCCSPSRIYGQQTWQNLQQVTLWWILVLITIHESLRGCAGPHGVSDACMPCSAIVVPFCCWLRLWTCCRSVVTDKLVVLSFPRGCHVCRMGCAAVATEVIHNAYPWRLSTFENVLHTGHTTTTQQTLA